MYDLFILPQLTGMTSICRGEMCIRDCLAAAAAASVCGLVSICPYSFGGSSRSHVPMLSMFSRREIKKKKKKIRVRCLRVLAVTTRLFFFLFFFHRLARGAIFVHN